MLFSNGDQIVFNKQQGYMLRTKMCGVDEGGVATGYSVLDTPCLVDSFPLAVERKNLNVFQDDVSGQWIIALNITFLCCGYDSVGSC